MFLFDVLLQDVPMLCGVITGATLELRCHAADVLNMSLQVVYTGKTSATFVAAQRIFWLRVVIVGREIYKTSLVRGYPGVCKTQSTTIH